MNQNACATAGIMDPLFETAHGAIVFAFNFSGQTIDRPMMNRIAAPSLGSGKGLVGNDGAAQAGMIRREVKELGRLFESILIARHAPRMRPCACRAACCSGHKPNKEWVDAISYLADHIRTTALAGCTSNGMLRREYVIRHFSRKDERISIEDLAEKYEVARNTISAHSSKVAVLFGGTPARRDQPAIPGIEQAANEAIGDKLRAIGLTG